MSNSLRTALRKGGAAVLGGSLLASGLVLGGPTPSAHAHEETDPVPARLAANWLADEPGLLTGLRRFLTGVSASTRRPPSIRCPGTRRTSRRSPMPSPTTSPTTRRVRPSATRAATYCRGHVEGGRLRDLGRRAIPPTSAGSISSPASKRSSRPPAASRTSASFGDYANAFGQIFAARVLTDRGQRARAGGRRLPARAAVQRGLVPPRLHAPVGRRRHHQDPATNAGCNTATGSKPSVDATALAISTLLPLAPSDAASTPRSRTPRRGSSRPAPPTGRSTTAT